MSKAETLHELYLTCQTIDFDDTNQLIEQAESDDEKRFIRIITDCILQESSERRLQKADSDYEATCDFCF